MTKINNLSHKLFDAIFSGKRIIITTDKKTKQLKVSGLLQFFTILLLSFVISYFAIRYNKYKNYHNYALILDENDKLKEEHRQIREEFKNYEKKANKINEYLEVRGIDKPQKKDYKNLTNSEMVAILDEKTMQAYKKIDERKQEISNYVKKLGIQKITYNKLIKTAKVSKDEFHNTDEMIANVEDKTSIGGLDETVEDIKLVKSVPFLQVSNKKIDDKNYEKELKDIIIVEKTLQSLPFGIPTKGNYRLTSTYGFRQDPVKKDGKLRLHRGIDMVLDNQEVITPKDGVVKFSGTKSGYGNCIDIEHQVPGIQSKIITHYAHLKKIFVEKGQFVKAGDMIGVQGNTGRSTGPHLHYEIQINGQAVNPINFMKIGKI